MTQRMLRKYFNMLDFAPFKRSLSEPDPGLHAYNVDGPDGGSMRIHLRIEPDGNGVLFIDVTDVIHLNETAAKLAYFALEGYELDQVSSSYLKKYDQKSAAQITEDISSVYHMIEHISQGHDDCYTCALIGNAEMSPLFSVPVHAPYKVDIALTYGCNNACSHCYNEVSRLPMPSLPLSDWFQVLDKLAILGVPHLIITGGEATLHPNLAEVIQYADQLGMIVGLNTNGRHLSHEPYMQSLAEVGLNHVQVTLGSCDADVHNQVMGAKSFDQTVAGIRTAIESGIHVITNTTLMRLNMHRVEVLIDFLYDLGIRTFAMNGMIYSGGGFEQPLAIQEDEIVPILVRVRDYADEKGMGFLWYTPTEYCRLNPVELEIGAKRCNAGEYSLCIEPNGDVLPCQSYYVRAGNILSDPWESIWRSDLFLSFRQRNQRPEATGLPEMCWECPDLPLCGGGCRIEREARKGLRVAAQGQMSCGIGCGMGPMCTEIDREEPYYKPVGGYVPPEGQVNAAKRSGGK